MPDLQGNTVIVIDPGHGGENLGAQVDGYTEKEMTMIVAKAMKEELETYDNVVVYLTRESDQELSLEERAQFAKDRNADFLRQLVDLIRGVDGAFDHGREAGDGQRDAQAGQQAFNAV